MTRAAHLPARRLAGLVAALLLLAGCSSQPAAARPTAVPRGSPAPSAAAPSPARPLAPPGPLSFRVDAVATGLQVPWALAFLPDGTILVTERPGRVRVISNGRLLPGPALTLNVDSAPGNESGLLGLAVQPGFPNPPYVYVYYTYDRASQGKTDRVSRFTYSAGTLTEEHVVLDGLQGGSCCHFGGRLAFGPDGMLYVTVGDAQQPARAVDPGSPNGKVLRIRDDGSIPADNPFPGSPVWAYGLRNPEGLAWDAAGRLYVSNNGPTGEFGLFHNDEIDLVQRGAFYGWPVKAGDTPAGRPQDYGNPPERVPPVAWSGNAVTWAPSGMTFYSPRAGEEPTLLVAGLAAQALLRFTIPPDSPGTSSGPEVLLRGLGRLRDAEAGPDGCLYVLTSNRDGRGSPQPGDDRVLRLCPQP